MNSNQPTNTNRGTESNNSATYTKTLIWERYDSEKSNFYYYINIKMIVLLFKKNIKIYIIKI